ncbi:LysM peptidoglycan-binding domain-containing protein [Acanthopleuribacter pedis]|uniref:LysM peptidoglycan-binding domain-containing protein n=1 Tax=Acanthopleuribacter pedis TaxID=442870 RepID=A0A8J7QIQ6_9BACT|nr:LysM peptidoglycan-binding domain-containing protein [Acanthopleuribacter pedis]MBO1321050.1 LysM peptidoglycan-binding domain-containing protein [Acanthopleuribacter pedis]
MLLPLPVARFVPFLLLIGFGFLSCGPKQSLQTQGLPEPTPKVDTTVSEEPTPSEQMETVEEATLPPQETALAEVEPEVWQDPDPSPLPEPVVPELTARERLEGALSAYELAREAWLQGDLETAVGHLDAAYEGVMSVDEKEHPDILQEKDDLRYLISKRVVEIYASRTTSVGDLRKSIPIEINEHVEAEIRSFQKRERRFFIESYKRAGRYLPMIEKVLAENGMPAQLAWLPLIESGFKTNALSRARALGMWQFIPSTGYRYGMERNRFVDERMDPVKSTNSAIAYLQDLHGLFGDWLTALAAYNCGEGRVQRTINRQRLNYLDHFWDLYNNLPRETARYVPRFIATLAILEDPAKYGFDLPEQYPPLDFETVKIEQSVYLSELEKRLGLTAKSLKMLNPELRYGLTPGDGYMLKVPSGQVEATTAAVANMEPGQIPVDTSGVHRVRRGDSLSAIAKRYGTSVTRLVQANKLKSRDQIWPGQKLVIPGRRGRVMPAPGGGSGDWVTHKVRRGDNLWRLAEQYGTTVQRIKQWNQMSGSRLSLGQQLKIKQQPAGKKTYRVRRGDTLAKIAAKHGISLRKLLAANQLSKRDKIYPNQALLIP